MLTRTWWFHLPFATQYFHWRQRRVVCTASGAVQSLHITFCVMSRAVMCHLQFYPFIPSGPCFEYVARGSQLGVVTSPPRSDVMTLFSRFLSAFVSIGGHSHTVRVHRHVLEHCGRFSCSQNVAFAQLNCKADTVSLVTKAANCMSSNVFLSGCFVPGANAVSTPPSPPPHPRKVLFFFLPQNMRDTFVFQSWLGSARCIMCLVSQLNSLCVPNLVQTCIA